MFTPDDRKVVGSDLIGRPNIRLGGRNLILFFVLVAAIGLTSMTFGGWLAGWLMLMIGLFAIVFFFWPGVINRRTLARVRRDRGGRLPL